MADTAEILRDLARAKAAFQLEAIKAVVLHKSSNKEPVKANSDLICKDAD